MQNRPFKIAKPYVPKSALHITAQDGNVEHARLLLAYGNVDINVRDNTDWTPLHHAAFHGHLEMVKLLLANNADLHALDVEGVTPLHEATRGERRHSLTDGHEHAEIVSFLLEKGANPNAKDNDGYTALHYIACPFYLMRGLEQKEFVKMAKSLLAKGAHLETKNNYGETALHLAAREGWSNIVKLLLNHGADRQTLTHSKKTPSDLAKENNHPEIEKLISQRNKYGKLFQPVPPHLVQKAYEKLGYQTKSVLKR